MAILNYSKTYQEVLNEFNTDNNINITDPSQLSEEAKGYIKLFFTGDGNIITHGVNYLPLFTQSHTGKGLVPINTSEENKNLDFLRGDGSWAKIVTTDLPIWKPEDVVYDTTKILDAFTVKQMVDASFAANDAMRFKGVITDVSQLPTSWEAGDTYRIGKPGTYFQKVGEVGDLLICITTGSTSDENYNLEWTMVQNNIEGVTTVNVNGAPIKLYSNSESNVGQTYDICGPRTVGSSNQILVGALSTNSAPEWASVEGLTISGNQGSRKIVLNKASSSTLGGVIIDGIGNTGGKVTSGDTVSINSNGSIYLTPTNIANALGFMPTNPDDLQDALTRADRTKDGLAPLFDNIIAPSLDVNTWLLGVTKGATAEDDKYGWYPIPSTAFSDTWRKILIGGVDIEDAELHINPSSDVCVDFDKNPNDDVVSISFGLSWWNVTTGAYETE